MADRMSRDKRSALMARIKRSNTRPELAVRQLLHRMGYRFRIQLAGVPGRPDIAFTKKKKAIFVHGCFWHAHEGCPVHKIPKTRTDFWRAKFARNKERDQRLLKEAEARGWSCLVLWECELDDLMMIGKRLKQFLGNARTVT